MKKKSKQIASWLLVIIFFLMLELFSGPAPLTAQNVNLGLSLADGRLLGFYFSISKYFNVPSETVIDIRSRYRLATGVASCVLYRPDRPELSRHLLSICGLKA